MTVAECKRPTTMNTIAKPIPAGESSQEQLEKLPPLKPVFVVGGLYSLANGVAWIMRDLAAALGRRGAPVTVCAADCWGRGAESIGQIFEPPSAWIASKGLWLGGLSWSPRLKRRMSGIIEQADVVHSHSLWMLPNSYGSRIAARRSKPVVITAHGALEPWAVKNSGWKKRLTGWAFQDRDLRNADCIHVNSRSEIAGIRQYGLQCPVAVIPNGVHLPDFEHLPSRDTFREHCPQTTGKRIALFMARLHEKKGLGHLIPAWANIAREFADWHLVLAGPDSGYEAAARQLVEECGVSSSVSFAGGLLGEQKLAALAAADVFLQPSFSEGFSMSIIEAMACRLPVLLTPGCNFPQAADAEAGVCIDPDIPGTTDGLGRLLTLTPAECRDMGARGRSLVEAKYTWDRVAADTLALYRWLDRGGPVPDSVEVV